MDYGRPTVPERTTMRGIPRRAAIAVATLATVAIAAPARAAFAPVGDVGLSADDRICDTRAAAGRLSVLACYEPVVWRASADGGRTWGDVGSGGLTNAASLSVTSQTFVAYGQIREPGSFPGRAAFAVLAPGAAVAAAAVEIAGPEPYDMAEAGIPNADGGGRVVASRPDGRLLLLTVGADGAVSASIDLGVSGSVTRMTRDVSGAIWVRHLGVSDESWIVSRDGQPPVQDVLGPATLDLGDGNALHESGQRVAGIRFQGEGAHPVAGAPGLWITELGDLKTLWRGDLLVPAWYRPPDKTVVVSDGQSLFATYAVREGGFAPDPSVAARVWSSPIEPSAPESAGAVPASGLEMVRAANGLRADAGLPPLIADGLISKASENHSRYWTLNPPVAGLGMHSETPGRPGFTGADPSARCAAVGTTCGGEILFGGAAPRAAVIGWMTTTFHRWLIGDPDASIVGGARSGAGPSVMNGRYAGSAILLRPRGMPTGTWKGQLGFGGETPDPGSSCAAAGRARITAPYGAAVTVTLPAEGAVTLTGLTLRRARDGRALAGCLLGNAFTPDDALQPGTDYEATATWAVTLGAQPLPPYVWRFKTQGTPPASAIAASRRAAGVRVGAKARKLSGRWRVTIVGARAAGRTARITVRRMLRRCTASRRCSFVGFGPTASRTIKLRATQRLALPARTSRRVAWRATVRVASFTRKRLRYRATSLRVTVR